MEGMANGPEIKAAREKLGLSQQAVASAVGISQPAYKKIEDGITQRSRFTPEIERFLKLAVDDIGSGEFEAVSTFGRKDLKVFSAAEGGPGELIVSTRPIDIVVRPWYLEHVEDGFAVLVTGDSMVPSFRPGDYAIVNPRLPPMRHEDMIFIAAESEGEFRATIKHLVRWTDREWFVEQHNPGEGQPSEFTLSRDLWRKALRVVGRYRR